MLNSAEEISRELFQEFRDLIARRTGIILGASEGPGAAQMMLRNRLARPMARANLPNFRAYLQNLQQAAESSDLWVEFVHAVSTHKTEFFREPGHFETLARHAVETSIRRRLSPAPYMVWSSACSTGEEPYSIAITLSELQRNTPETAPRQFTIVATDIDPVVVASAKKGIYPSQPPSVLNQAMLERYFLNGVGKQSGYIRVRETLRQAVQFDTFNLIQPKYSGRPEYDAIFCRNVLIYFDQPTRDAIVTRLLRQLAPGGILLLGHAESFSFREDLDIVAPTVYTARTQTTAAQLMEVAP